jgi:hypothetical protein
VILVGDNREVLPTLPARSVHMVVTSPSYYGLRDYGHEDQIGLEETPEQYVANLVAVFREVKRVLRDDGAVWLNLGDSFNDGNLLGIPWRVAFALQADGWTLRSAVCWHKINPMPESVAGWRWERCRVKMRAQARRSGGWKGQAQSDRAGTFKERYEYGEGVAEYTDCPGCPRCAPNDGLVLRRGSWRPTSAHEYVFLLSKAGAEYFCDGEALREDCSATSHGGPNVRPGEKNVALGHHSPDSGGLGKWSDADKAAGRNARDVWSITSNPSRFAHCSACNTFYPGGVGNRTSTVKARDPRQETLFDLPRTEAPQTPNRKVCRCGRDDAWVDHFALMPAELARRCVKTAPGRCCSVCGAAWVAVVDKSPATAARENWNGNHASHNGASRPGGFYDRDCSTLGHRPACTCDTSHLKVPWLPATVLDPFAGANTTGVVCAELGRNYIGIELRPEYARLGEERERRASREQIGMEVA